MGVYTEVPMSNPMRAAWERYKKTEKYATTRRWALKDEHVDGSLWAAFCEGYAAAQAEVEREAREAARDAATEQHWKEVQGDDYGSY